MEALCEGGIEEDRGGDAGGLCTSSAGPTKSLRIAEASVFESIEPKQLIIVFVPKQSF